jgi:hypothetical protein|tara:strand:- start:538 stop:1782 length:1245 start_codon:yes stop_codon:yes gene_type:complete
MGNPFKKLFNKLGDALIPKELAPFIGPLTSMFAPQLGLPAALIGGQLASAKMHGGSLDPFQALAATGSYYGGGGQEIRARGENLTQRLGAGLGSAFNQPAGTTGGGFNRFTKGFSKGADKVIGDGSMDRILGSSSNTKEYDNFLFKESKLKNKTAEIDKKLAEGTITQAQYDLSLDAIYSQNPDLVDLKDPRGFFTKAGDIFKKGSEGFMPGFAERDADGNIIPGSFDFKNFMKTTAAVTSLTQLKPIAEELKRANMKSKEEEGAVYRRYFQQYEDSLPLDADGNKQTYISHAGEYADPIMVKKYREYMAKGGIIGYSNGGMTRQRYNMGGGIGSIPQTPTVPEGMQLDGRGGGFIPMGAQEKKDDVPAMLAKNEFVLTADAMRGFDKANGGDGNPRDAAAKMYEIMSNYEAMA